MQRMRQKTLLHLSRRIPEPKVFFTGIRLTRLCLCPRLGEMRWDPCSLCRFCSSTAPRIGLSAVFADPHASIAPIGLSPLFSTPTFS